LNAITIEILGEPIPQPRARITTRCGFGQAYTPKAHPIHAYRQAIALTWKSAVGITFDGPLRVTMEFRFTKPKSARREWHTVKPDVSNCAKGVEDCLNGVAWGDDSQIVELIVRKSYGVPRTVVSVEEVN
jgi:Holliday junction resolvase RusA-like endonuclease